MSRFLKSFASLKLTVVLLSLSMVLVFLGTLAQARLGVWEVVHSYFRSPIAWIDAGLFLPPGLGNVQWSIPIPGGLTLGVLLLVNLLAAHAVRFRFTAKRAGMNLLHAGILVLLVGEFVTGIFSREGMMSIDEGGSSNFVEDLREVELAFVDSSDAETDRVVAIPEWMLVEASQTGKPITHPEVPFTISVDRWITNADLVVAVGETSATEGVGLEAMARELAPARGADGAQTNVPAAYVSLSRDGEKVGTWLVYTGLIEPQQTAELSMALRYRRTYLPFTVELIDFRHDIFEGTQIARNFSSRIRLVDPEHQTDRETLISMNNPLRYRGETFYQASYKPDGSGTVLQVVRNPGAWLPYLACIMVGIGLSVHFVIALWEYLRRQRTARAREENLAGGGPSGLLRAVPYFAGAVGLLFVFSTLLRQPPASDYDFETFGRLPVSAGGRVKPVDSAARNLLMVAGGRQSVSGDASMPATEFFVRLLATPESVSELPVVRVDHPDVLAQLGLTLDEGGRIPLSVIQPHWNEIDAQARMISDIPSKRQDPVQRATISLHQRVSTILSHSSMIAPYVIPPSGPGEPWKPFTEAFQESGMANAGGIDPTARTNPAVVWYVSMLSAFSEHDSGAFNRAVAGYNELLRKEMPTVMHRSDLEVLFNRANLFTGAMALYVLGFLLLCFGILARSREVSGGGSSSVATSLRSTALGLLWAAVIVHTLAICLRIYLQGRPPVTNLYSSAVFIGWAAVLIGLAIEYLHRLGIAALCASAIGFATLVVAHNLGSDGDTMQMMQAVLDSNFWLATHVVVITLGYSATFLAGTLASVYVLMGVFTRWLTADRGKSLARMTYGTVCFALLLSFVGTVLGGIWADQSWGRFWGWDPKENGAALIVLMNALILHARWGGMIRDRGLMLLAIGGNVITAWSWFGTNMLGVGLHSYGFMDSAVFWLMAYVMGQLALIAVGLIPLLSWRSRGGNGPRGAVAN